MSGDDARVRIDQDRIYESELGDTGGDLRDLRVAVRARILRVRNQPVNRPDLDAPRHRGRDDCRQAHATAEQDRKAVTLHAFPFAHTRLALPIGTKPHRGFELPPARV